MLSLQSRSRRIAVLTVLSSLLFATIPTTADPIMDICSSNGCDTVSTFLDPCGGGATNSSLQQDYVYTVTPILGSCECNSAFYNAFSSCLACIRSQGKSSPEIDNQQNWVAECASYGFNFTAAPINFTAPTSGDDSSNGGGVSKGAVAGIIIAVLLVAALAGGFFFFKNRTKRTKGSIFARPYSAAGTDVEDGNSTHPTFNAYSNYQNAAYPETAGGYSDQDHQYYGYQDHDQDQHNYGSDQNDLDSDAMMMNNLRHNSYIPPPIPMSPAAVAAVGSSIGNLGSPRPGDEFPQNRPKNKDWEGRQYEFTSDLISTDQLIHDDKAAIEDEEELEPPRARDRYVNDNDDFTSRRSLTPPRANMQSYRDEFTRPSFDREPRNSSERSGANLIRGVGGYDSNEEDGTHESPESARRRRAAELFSAEGTRR
ncbi:hypothetical protein BGZ79_007484 [Entomortierella chlamydospora]|nr:hypothetical protein BGZ79_007484 [Entomortierella chlamydospora]